MHGNIISADIVLFEISFLRRLMLEIVDLPIPQDAAISIMVLPLPNQVSGQYARRQKLLLVIFQVNTRFHMHTD